MSDCRFQSLWLVGMLPLQGGLISAPCQQSPSFTICWMCVFYSSIVLSFEYKEVSGQYFGDSSGVLQTSRLSTSRSCKPVVELTCEREHKIWHSFAGIEIAHFYMFVIILQIWKRNFSRGFRLVLLPLLIAFLLNEKLGRCLMRTSFFYNVSYSSTYR